MTVILFDLVNDISLNANTFESKIFENKYFSQIGNWEWKLSSDNYNAIFRIYREVSARILLSNELVPFERSYRFNWSIIFHGSFFSRSIGKLFFEELFRFSPRILEKYTLELCKIVYDLDRNL